MRDINRIHPFIEKLEELWSCYPDYRFFQLISSLSEDKDLFYQEDEVTLESIEFYLSEYKHNRNYEDNKESIYKEILDKVTYIFKDKVDKGNNPYINHLTYVANKQDSLDGKIIGLLHDILEDTDTTVDDLYSWGLPSSIIEDIQLLTKVPEVAYKEYINKICLSGSLEVLKVKLDDLENNMDITRVENPETIKKLIEERYKSSYDKIKMIYEKEKAECEE